MIIKILRIIATVIFTFIVLVAAGCAGAKRSDLHQTLRQNEFRNPEGEPRMVGDD